MKLPNPAKAVVDPSKVRDYLLSPSHPVGRFKAAFFVRLGYEATDWERLRADLRQLPAQHDATEIERTRYGTKYELRATLRGPPERAARVVTAWIVRTDEDFPRLVTAYPGDAP